MTGPFPVRDDGRLTVALVSEVFWEPDGAARLEERLDEAARRGADLAVLPEMALNAWRPATREAVDGDAETEGGPRTQVMAGAANRAGIGLGAGGTRAVPGPVERLQHARGLPGAAARPDQCR